MVAPPGTRGVFPDFFCFFFYYKLYTASFIYLNFLFMCPNITNFYLWKALEPLIVLELLYFKFISLNSFKVQMNSLSNFELTLDSQVQFLQIK